MERARVSFSDAARPARSGALVLDDDGTVALRVSGALGAALDAAIGDASADLAPLRFDSHGRGLALAAALARSVDARLLECEFRVGSFEVRGYLAGRRVRLTLRPGDFDADEAWAFLLAMNDARLEPPTA
jgi:hypothetical protein